MNCFQGALAWCVQVSQCQQHGRNAASRACREPSSSSGSQLPSSTTVMERRAGYRTKRLPCHRFQSIHETTTQSGRNPVQQWTMMMMHPTHKREQKLLCQGRVACFTHQATVRKANKAVSRLKFHLATEQAFIFISQRLKVHCGSSHPNYHVFF